MAAGWLSKVSPRHRARLAGLFYLLIFVVAPSGASTATVANLSVTLACDVTVALLFYSMFAPVNRGLALVSSLFRLVFVVFMAVNALIYFGVVHVSSIASTPADAFNLGYGISLVPFAVHCLLCGILILRSVFLPKILGVLLLTAGAAYALFVWPPLGDRLFFPYIVIPAVLGEGSLTLWLLIMGVNEERWRQQEAVRIA